MPKKKEETPKKDLEKAGFFEGYDYHWMKDLKGEHPDYNKVMKAARKAKYTK